MRVGIFPQKDTEATSSFPSKYPSVCQSLMFQNRMTEDNTFIDNCCIHSRTFKSECFVKQDCQFGSGLSFITFTLKGRQWCITVLLCQQVLRSREDFLFLLFTVTPSELHLALCSTHVLQITTDERFCAVSPAHDLLCQPAGKLQL